MDDFDIGDFSDELDEVLWGAEKGIAQPSRRLSDPTMSMDISNFRLNPQNQDCDQTMSMDISKFIFPPAEESPPTIQQEKPTPKQEKPKSNPPIQQQTTKKRPREEEIEPKSGNKKLRLNRVFETPTQSLSKDSSLSSLSSFSQKVNPTTTEKKSAYSTMPPLGPCMYITSKDGERIYVGMDHEFGDDDPDEEFELTPITKKKKSVLSVPMKELNRRVEEMQSRQAFFNELTDLDSDHIVLPDAQLWVDKYAPKTFIELLSDDKANRSILGWLKEWDPSVFKRPYQPIKEWGRKTDPVISKFNDGRPERLILLLHGPPGIGKTTLAHVIAKHAGYNPIEINASDDRTKKTFLPRVMDILEIESVSFSGVAKPKCLIIDEIDGILGHDGDGAIDGLLKILDDKEKKKTVPKAQQSQKSQSQKSPVKSKPAKRSPRIRRPIICICNDPYVPALRALKERATVFKLSAPLPKQLLARLVLIAKSENIKIDTRTLQALAELSSCDIRSTVNTLQFLSKTNKHVSSDLITKSAFGVKDMTDGIFDIWESVFVKTTKSTILQTLINEKIRDDRKKGLDVSSIQKNESNDMYNIISRFGDTEKIIDGLFSHYLSISYNDTMMKKTQEIISWLEYYSTMNHNSFGQFELLKYNPVVGVAVHSLANVTYIPPGTIKYPSEVLQLPFNILAKKNLFGFFKTGMKASTRQTLPNSYDAIQEFLPDLLTLISPSALESQVSNSQADTAASSKERLLSNVLNVSKVYATYGLSLKEETNESEDDIVNPTWTLVPPVDSLITYTALPSKFGKASPKVYQMLQNGIKNVVETAPKEKESPSSKIAVASQKKKSPVKMVEVPDKPEFVEVTDFFGRKSLKRIVHEVREVPKISFRFHEVTTSGVKRKVFLKDFL